MRHAGLYVMAVVALALSIGTLHKERKTRHRVEQFLKDGGEVVRDGRRVLEEQETLVEDVEGVRVRVEALWEVLGRPEGAASVETARR